MLQLLSWLNELRLAQKTSRMKQSLEAAMCRADQFSADELLQ